MKTVAKERQLADLMPKKEFIRCLAQELDVTQGVAIEVIEAVEKTVLDGLREFEKVKLGDLVVFNKKHVPARSYILPGETESQLCEAYDKVVCTMNEKNRKLKPKKRK